MGTPHITGGGFDLLIMCLFSFDFKSGYFVFLITDPTTRHRKEAPAYYFPL
jgi:hypothetical protein